MNIYHNTLEHYEQVSRDSELEYIFQKRYKNPVMAWDRNDLAQEFAHCSDAQLKHYISFGERALCELYLRQQKKTVRHSKFFMYGVLLMFAVFCVAKAIGA